MDKEKFYNDYIDNIKKQGLSFNYNFLKKKFNRERLAFRYNNSVIVFNEIIFNRFVEILSLCNDIFPNKWDLKLELFKQNNKKYLIIVGIVIHFPKVIITNSKDIKHEILDLFIVLNLINISKGEDKNLISIKNISGFRTTFKHKEILSNYCHSHISADLRELLETQSLYYLKEILKERYFCLGSSDLQISIGNMDLKYDINYFLNLFMGLITLSQWESLEGSPYNRIENIKVKKTGLTRTMFNLPQKKLEKNIDEILDFWSSIENKPDLNIVINNNNIDIYNIQKLFDLPKGVFNKYRNIFFASEEDGFYYSLKNNDLAYPEVTNLSIVPPYIFRRNYFYYKVVDILTKDTEEDSIVMPNFVEDLIKRYLIKKLKYEIYKRNIKKREDFTYHM